MADGKRANLKLHDPNGTSPTPFEVNDPEGLTSSAAAYPFCERLQDPAPYAKIGSRVMEIRCLDQHSTIDDGLSRLNLSWCYEAYLRMTVGKDFASDSR